MVHFTNKQPITELHLSAALKLEMTVTLQDAVSFYFSDSGSVLGEFRLVITSSPFPVFRCFIVEPIQYFSVSFILWLRLKINS